MANSMLAPTQRTCFVISPIGAEGSEIRTHANDFLEVLVEPALQKFQFAVTRADRIASPSAITTDIVRLVQESDLCIIDLTFSNANVFYECGRRHETGRPFIQLVLKGHESKLPFDVAGIRTIIYDLSTPRASLDSVKRLQDFIDSVVASGFKAVTGGESLSSIAQTVERIERKLTQILSVPMSAAKAQTEVEDIRELMQSPLAAFHGALKRGNLDSAFAKLDKLRKIVSPIEFLTAVCWLVAAGHGRSFELLDLNLTDLLSSGSDGKIDRDEAIQQIAGAAKMHFENIGDLTAGSKYLQTMYSKLELATVPVSVDTLAFAANQVGMLAWTANEFDVCIRYTKFAIVHQPAEPAYYYNLSLVLKETSQIDEFEKTMKRLAELPDLDSQHVKYLDQHGFSRSI